jgi:pimeloyl-ACP methyl ester carboxylesterase
MMTTIESLFCANFAALLPVLLTLAGGAKQSHASMDGNDITPTSLVLLPGLDGSGLLFRPLVAALPATITPVVLQYPGKRRLNYEELLPLVLNAIPPSDPFVVLGESFSGPLAVMVAARRPKNLIGLILCASFVTAPWPMIAPAVSVLAHTPIFRLYKPYKRLRRRLLGYSKEDLALRRQMDRLIHPKVIAHRVNTVFQTDVRESLRSCNIPMLYLKGNADWVVPAWNHRVIQRVYPQMQSVSFACSHMVLQQQPSQAAQAISRFIRSIQAESGFHESNGRATSIRSSEPSSPAPAAPDSPPKLPSSDTSTTPPRSGLIPRHRREIGPPCTAC